MRKTQVEQDNSTEPVEQLRAGLEQLAVQRADVARYRRYLTGNQPAGYMSPEAVSALENRMKKLVVNFPRLVVAAHAERLALAAMRFAGNVHVPVWATFRALDGDALASLIHADRNAFGAAYVTVWHADGAATLTGDAPDTMTLGRDPSSGEPLWALRSWRIPGNPGGERAVLYRPDVVIAYYTANATSPDPSAWQEVDCQENPFGALPVTGFVRRQGLTDGGRGSSMLDDVLDLTDAIAKLCSDALVTSEFHARPRRWATGLEIQEDDEGNPVDPFAKKRLLQSEDPETKFGQLDGARLDGYGDLIATLTQQVGALTGLPPHYLGLHGDQPASADGVKAAEAQLVAAAYAAQRQLNRPWARVAWLLEAARARGGPALALTGALPQWSVEWQSPETRTPSQAADAALKLRQIGVPLPAVLSTLDVMTAEQIAELI